MPLIALQCLNEHLAEQYVHAADDKGAETRVCACGETLAPVMSVGRGLTWFSESSGRWVNHLGVNPVYITSHTQHVAEMKRAGVEWATERNVQGTGGWV